MPKAREVEECINICICMCIFICLNIYEFFLIRKICCTLYTLTEIAAVNTNRMPSVNYLHSFQLLLQWQRCLQMIHLAFFSVKGTGELTSLFRKDFG